MGNESPTAVVREVDGQLVLDDPVGLAVLTAVEKCNCASTVKLQQERILYFLGRIRQRGLDPKQVIVVIINVDDPHGNPIAEGLMPGHNWQEYRDRGETPYARGIAQREGLIEAVSLFDEQAAYKMKHMLRPAVLVIDYGVAEVFELLQP